MNLDIIIQILAPIFGGLGGFLLGRKRNKLENQGLEAQNIGENLDLYQKMLDDLEERFNKRLSNEKQENAEKNKLFEEKLVSQKKYYQEKINALSKRVSELKKELQNCKKMYK